MKKVLSILICTLLVFTSFVVATAEDKPVAVYSLGELQGEVVPGATVAIPVYLTVENTPLVAVNFKMQFDEEAFTFVKFKKSVNGGEHNLDMYISGITEKDSSVLSEMIFSADGATTSEFNNTLLCTVSFTVNEAITDGKYAFKIVESLINNDSMESTDFEEASLEITFGDSKTEEDGKTDSENTDEENKNEENTDDGDDEYVDDDEITEVDDETEENKPEENKPESKPEEKPESKPEDKPVAPQFSDLGGYEWAYDYIMPLAQQGVIRGTSETTFAPANNITRADFMVLLTRLLEIGGKAEDGFDDVPADAYFADAVANAKNMGIAKGSEGKFNPYNSITREDMCVLVYRALVSMSYLPVIPDDGSFERKFGDIAEISDYAMTPMKELSANGIIGGSDGKVNPKGFATRAETAVIMYRIQQLIPEF